MKENILIGIVLLIIGFIVLFKAIKYPGKGTGIFTNFKEYIICFLSFFMAIMYLLDLW